MKQLEFVQFEGPQYSSQWRAARKVWVSLIFLSVLLSGCTGGHDRALHSKVQPLQYRLYELTNTYPPSLHFSSDEESINRWNDSVEEARQLLTELEAVEGTSESNLSRRIEDFRLQADEIVTLSETISRELGPDVRSQGQMEWYKVRQPLEDQWIEAFHSYQTSENQLLSELHSGEGQAFEPELEEDLSQLSEATLQSAELGKVITSLEEPFKRYSRARLKDFPGSPDQFKAPISELEKSVQALEAIEVQESLLNLQRDLIRHQNKRLSFFNELSKLEQGSVTGSQFRTFEKEFSELVRRSKRFQDYSKSRFKEEVPFFQTSP